MYNPRRWKKVCQGFEFIETGMRIIISFVAVYGPCLIQVRLLVLCMWSSM